MNYGSKCNMHHLAHGKSMEEPEISFFVGGYHIC